MQHEMCHKQLRETERESHRESGRGKESQTVQNTGTETRHRVLKLTQYQLFFQVSMANSHQLQAFWKDCS